MKSLPRNTVVLSKMKSLLVAGAATAFQLEYTAENTHAFTLNLNSGASLSSYVLENVDIFLHSAGQKYSARDGSLELIDSFMHEMNDKLGHYEMYVSKWTYADGKSFNTVLKNYMESDLAIFEQHFMDAIDDSSVGRKDKALSGFPVLSVNNENDDIGFITPGGNCMGWTKFAAGKYHVDDLRDAPLDGRFVTDRNGGIVMLFGGDSHAPDGLILSPFNNFMAMHNVLDLEQNELYYGVQGGTKESRFEFFIRSHIGLNEVVIADHERVILRRPVFHVLLLPVLMFHFMRQFEQTLG